MENRNIVGTAVIRTADSPHCDYGEESSSPTIQRSKNTAVQQYSSPIHRSNNTAVQQYRGPTIQQSKMLRFNKTVVQYSESIHWSKIQRSNNTAVQNAAVQQYSSPKCSGSTIQMSNNTAVQNAAVQQYSSPIQRSNNTAGQYIGPKYSGSTIQMSNNTTVQQYGGSTTQQFWQNSVCLKLLHRFAAFK